MDLKDKIVALLNEEKKILVFPTESVKRFYLTEYVKTYKKSILASNALAFDEFASLFSIRDENLKPINRYMKLIFSSNFLKERGSELTYFFNKAYPETASRFVPFIAKIASQILSIDSFDCIKEIEHDLRVIKESYESFLVENNLFDPNSMKYNLDYYTGPRDIQYLLIAYDAEVNMQNFLRYIPECELIKPISLLSEDPKGSITQYDNLKAEIISLFDTLEELRDKEVNLEDIIISSPNVDEVREYLSHESRERGIPLSFTSNIKLSHCSSGRLFLDLKRIYDDDLSFESLEGFLLNNIYPFKDKESCVLVLQEMIDKGLVKGSFTKRDECEKKLSYNALILYRLIKYGIKSLFTSQNVLKSLHSFLSSIFVEGEFEATSQAFRDSYAFIMKELNQFCENIKTIGIKIDNPLNLFISELDRINYVPSERDEGIKVYSYKEDYLLDVKYHFVINLNEENSKVLFTDLSFLEEFEAVKIQSIDVSDNLIKYYLSFGANLSGSSLTYKSPVGVPLYFLKNNRIERCEISRERRYTRSTKSSLITSSGSSFYKASKSDEVRYSLQRPQDRCTISYSGLNDYNRCPYIRYLEKVINIEKDSRFKLEPLTLDGKYLGNILHSCFEIVYKNHLNEKIYDLEKLDRECEEVFNERLSLSGLNYYSLNYVKQNYLQWFISFHHLLYNEIGLFTPISIEKQIDYQDDENSYTSRVDAIFDSSSGYAIVDFKTYSSVDDEQLLFYKAMVERVENKTISHLFYYKFNDDKPLNRVTLDKTKIDKIKEWIDIYSKGFKKGDFHSESSKENCKKCKHRAVCRRRFSIQ